MSTLLSGVRQHAENERATAMGRYRAILEMGDEATGEYVAELRALMNYLGKSQENVTADLSLVKEHLRLKALVGELPAAESEQERLDKEVGTLLDECAGRIKEIEGQRDAGLNRRGKARLKRMQCWEAVKTLSEMEMENRELFPHAA